MHIETDIFAAIAVTVSFERPDLIKRASQIAAAEGTILIIFQAILIVEME